MAGENVRKKYLCFESPEKSQTHILARYRVMATRLAQCCSMSGLLPKPSLAESPPRQPLLRQAALAVLRGTARGGASVEAVANMAALKARFVFEA